MSACDVRHLKSETSLYSEWFQNKFDSTISQRDCFVRLPPNEATVAHVGWFMHSVVQYNNKKKSPHASAQRDLAATGLLPPARSVEWARRSGKLSAAGGVRTPRELSPSWWWRCGGKTVGSRVAVATLHALLSQISDCLQFA